MPVWLTFIVCLSSGSSCHQTIPTDQPFVGLSACQVQGMMLAPSWAEAHHGWRVDKIRCSPGNPPVDTERA